MSNKARSIPAVHVLLRDPLLAPALRARGAPILVETIRQVLGDVRSALRQGIEFEVSTKALALQVLESLSSDAAALRTVLNATGVLLHTGLGRAPLAHEAVEAMAEVARGYCNLELDLESGDRGRRVTAVTGLLCRLTRAEAATVVNNNAAATMLALKALAQGREVIVARGQLVEIGGAFRLPEIFEASGARLREIGTTNKVRLTDYERAIGRETAAILHVHASNYRIVGFTESVGIAELVSLAHAHGLSAIDDIGSGALDSRRPGGIGLGEPTFRGSIEAGADLVLGSGDKLLGGPQCGILVGSRRSIDQVSADPFMRAVRVDKLTLSALEATLRLARDPDHAIHRIPLWSYLNATGASLETRATTIARALTTTLGITAEAIASTACLGGGSMPGEELPSFAVRVRPPYPPPANSSADLARRLRMGRPAVVSQTRSDAVVLDLRAIPAEDDSRLIDAVTAIFTSA